MRVNIVDGSGWFRSASDSTWSADEITSLSLLWLLRPFEES